MWEVDKNYSNNKYFCTDFVIKLTNMVNIWIK